MPTRSTSFLFTMMSTLLLSFAICYLMAILSNVVFVYHDVKDGTIEYSWESILGAILEIYQICLSVIGIVSLATALHSGDEAYLFEAVTMCNLQLSAGNNVGSLMLLYQPR
ncbi:hypothetical protein GQ44DRAFT_112754 [Phaeosphaeriaceae sp. PMI808]|nr:hypothetical protein GQ44DRAFT_112754 [Phaeosphaeriaceae sp. PMI808]